MLSVPSHLLLLVPRNVLQEDLLYDFSKNQSEDDWPAVPWIDLPAFSENGWQYLPSFSCHRSPPLISFKSTLQFAVFKQVFYFFTFTIFLFPATCLQVSTQPFCWFREPMLTWNFIKTTRIYFCFDEMVIWGEGYISSVLLFFFSPQSKPFVAFP